MSEISSQGGSGDSDELQALFDSVAAQRAPMPEVATQASPGDSGASGDSDALQALFDSVAAQQPAEPALPASSQEDESATKDRVFNRIGQMARELHDVLRELGYDKLLEQVVTDALPDTKDRLSYIANLTEQAACRVLNATDIARPLQGQLEDRARVLAERWDKAFDNRLGVDEFRQLAIDTRGFLKQEMPEKNGVIGEQLLEIMMAQDFQDLTGQVIKKIVSLAQNLESQLMHLLIEVMPGERRNQSVDSLLNGPVINPATGGDVVVSQQQVDDLLDSLGF